MRKDLAAGVNRPSNEKNQLSFDKEKGLIEETGRYVTQFYNMHRTNVPILIKTRAYMHDATYNSLRSSILKDNNSLQIRPAFENPSRLNFKEESNFLKPVTRFSVNGFNPALERRINYVWTKCCLPGQPEGHLWVNINYLIVDPVYETAFRSDVNRIETTNKMVLKPNEEYKREEEFCNVTTPFRDAVRIMLREKFYNFFNQSQMDQGDADGKSRDKQIFEFET